MKREVLFVLLDAFADWEGAYLSAALNTGLGIVPSEAGTAYTPKTFSPVKNRVRSLGGLIVVPDYDASTVPGYFAAVILVGGMGWQSDEAAQVVPLVERALANGRLVGAICNATLFMGAHGFLNDVRHTSNTPDLLKTWGGERYTGKRLYEERQAVRDGLIVTANGTACLEFTRECLHGLEAGTPEEIEAYYRFNKQGFYKE